jgi:restriction system protein
MARRKSILEHLMELSFRLPWGIAVGLAVVSFAVLHAIASAPQSPAIGNGIGDSASAVQHQFLTTLAAYLQIIAPMIFLAGALGSLLRRSRGTALLDSAAADAAAAIRGMSWSEFEQFIEEVFRRRGYAVAANVGIGPDGGVDAVLTNDQGQFLVRCKHWRARQVGVSVVRELAGVMSSRGAAGGFVVCSGTFTAEAHRFAARTKIELIDGPQLAAFIRSVGRHVSGPRTLDQKLALARSRPTGAEALPPSCPRCAGTMMLRTARRGATTGDNFWGCKRFPKCQGTLPI